MSGKKTKKSKKPQSPPKSQPQPTEDPKFITDSDMADLKRVFLSLPKHSASREPDETHERFAEHMLRLMESHLPLGIQKVYLCEEFGYPSELYSWCYSMFANESTLLKEARTQMDMCIAKVKSVYPDDSTSPQVKTYANYKSHYGYDDTEEKSKPVVQMSQPQPQLKVDAPSPGLCSNSNSNSNS